MEHKESFLYFASMESIGKKIKELRKKRGLTVYDVAKEAGVSHTAISNIETDKTKNISIGLGLAISKALNVSFNELFDIENNEHSPEYLKLKKEYKILFDEHYDMRNLLNVNAGISEIFNTQLKKLLPLLSEFESLILEANPDPNQPILEVITNLNFDISKILPHIESNIKRINDFYDKSLKRTE